MRITPIAAMESLSDIHLLEDRKVSKIPIQAEKLKRLPSHPMKQRCEIISRSRLEWISFAQHSTSLKHSLKIPTEDDSRSESHTQSLFSKHSKTQKGNSPTALVTAQRYSKAETKNGLTVDPRCTSYSRWQKQDGRIGNLAGNRILFLKQNILKSSPGCVTINSPCIPLQL
ncbi:hypothetical protein PoB_001456800 [Plakobranchus ocellatus]|uniref:Uncharacterized protein n=1 Tax=Plakobranchus ocellatus TaxID=259542 RepID=A0AAV3Z0A8_9GAST|nr:hypothetical protein PoB_001456800 [Plakobranchus ocellatus]